MNIRPYCFVFFLIVAKQVFAFDQEQKVVLLILDGVRWQEVFQGGDPTIANRTLSKDKFFSIQHFLSGTPQIRKELLMPRLWTKWIKDGQLLGNRNNHSFIEVANGVNMSYAGYVELLSGKPNPKITTNAQVTYNSLTVLDSYVQHSQNHKSVAAFGSWETFNHILQNDQKHYLQLRAHDSSNADPVLNLLERISYEIPKRAHDETLDAFTFHAAMYYLKTYKPTLSFISLGNADSYAHDLQYDNYLKSIHLFDRYIDELWTWLQSDRFYKDKTTLIVTADHGRGDTVNSWNEHGVSGDNSEQAWLFLIGPNVKPMGLRANTDKIYLAQVAPTIAEILSLSDFSSDYPSFLNQIS